MNLDPGKLAGHRALYCWMDHMNTRSTTAGFSGRLTRVFSLAATILLLLSIGAQKAAALPEETRYTGEVAIENTDPYSYIDDVSYGPFSIGFNFDYYGTTYTQFHATSNGLVCLGATSTSAYSNVSFPSASTPPCIAGFWDDIVISNQTLAGII